MKLDDIIDEQNKIHAELERMAGDDSTTEDTDGNFRDTLVARWQTLDDYRARSSPGWKNSKSSARQSEDRENRTDGDGGSGRDWAGSRGPEFMQRMDPFKDLDKVKSGPGHR